MLYNSGMSQLPVQRICDGFEVYCMIVFCADADCSSSSVYTQAHLALYNAGPRAQKNYLPPL